MKTNKPWLVFSLSLFAVAAFAEPPTIKINPEKTFTEYRVVGFTQTETTGRVEADGGALTGYAAMHKLCADEVAPNARAAFTVEAQRSPALPGAASNGWVIPSSPVPVFQPDVLSDAADWRGVDAAGHAGANGASPGQALANVSCVDYTNEVRIGAGVVMEAASGRFISALCVNSLPIACSAPVAIPVLEYSN